MTHVVFNPQNYTASNADIHAVRLWIDTILKTTGLTPPFRVIEFGCGSGKFSASFARRGCEVLATDADPGMLKQARKNFPQLFRTRIIKLPYIPPGVQGYDLAFSEGLIEHFSRRQQRIDILKAMSSCLKDRGCLVVYVPLDGCKDGEHIYTPQELHREFVDANIKHISLHYLHWDNRNGTHRQHLGCIGIKYDIKDAATWTKFQEESYSKKEMEQGSRLETVIDWLQQQRQQITGKTLMDIGCQHGKTTDTLGTLGYTTFGIDLPGVLRKKTYNKNTKGFIAADAHNVPIRSAICDVVIALEILEHMWNPEKLIEEIFRILRPGGLAIFSTPDGEDKSMIHPVHKHFWDIHTLKNTLSPHFTIIRTHTNNDTIIALVERRR